MAITYQPHEQAILKTTNLKMGYLSPLRARQSGTSLVVTYLTGVGFWMKLNTACQINPLKLTSTQVMARIFNQFEINKRKLQD